MIIDCLDVKKSPAIGIAIGNISIDFEFAETEIDVVIIVSFKIRIIISGSPDQITGVILRRLVFVRSIFRGFFLRRVGVERGSRGLLARIIDLGFRMVKNFAAYRFKGIGRSHFDTFGTSGPLKRNEVDAGSPSGSRPIAIIEGKIVCTNPGRVIKRDCGTKGKRGKIHIRIRTCGNVYACRRTKP